MLDNKLQRLSIALFLASLAVPALHLSKEGPVFGFTLLLWGWGGLFQMHFPWVANVLYYSSLENIRAQNYKRALWLCASCIPLGLLSYRVEMWFSNKNDIPITGLGVGFYLWIASFIVLSIELWQRQSRENTIPATNTIQNAQDESNAGFEKAGGLSK